MDNGTEVETAESKSLSEDYDIFNQSKTCFDVTNIIVSYRIFACIAYLVYSPNGFSNIRTVYTRENKPRLT